MSFKRQAGSQVTRENFRDLEEEDDDVPQPPARASAEVLAKRKILQPRSRLGASRASATKTSTSTAPSFNFQPASSTSSTNDDKKDDKPANPFASFGSFASSNTSSAAAPEKPSFNFGATTSTKETTTDKPAFSFGSSFAQPKTAEAEQPKTNQIFSFINSNGKSADSSTTSLVSTKASDKPSKIKALNDNFYEKITQQRTQDPVSNFTPILRKYIDYYDRIENDYDIPDADSESQLEQQEQQKALPAPSTTSTNNFSFGSRQTTESTAAKPAVPTFSFGAKPVETPKEETKPVAEEKSEAIDVDSDDSDDDIKVEGPKFTLEKPVVTEDSVFKLSKDTQTKSTSSNSEGTGPVFTFSGGSKKVDSVFKFSAPKKEEPEPKKEEPKPQPESKKEEQPAPAKPTFSFTSNTTSSTDNKKTVNNFTWSPNKSINLDDKSDSAKPAATPSFNFGKPAETKEEPKPNPFQFNFGGNNTNKSETTSDKPAFSFGSSSNSTTSTLGAFGKPASSSTFNFSFNAKPSTAEATSTTDSKPADGEDKVEEVEPDVNFKPVVQLSDKVEEKTGEEEEEALYTKKSKITLFNPETKAYDSKGLGELKVLRNKTTSKSRVLVRAEGSNRVVLNIAIVAGFKYETTGKGNFVRIPAAGESSIDTYLAQVKTAEDGSNLLNALLEAQKTA